MECYLTALLFVSLLSIPLGVQGLHPELVPAHRNPVIARRGSNVDLVCNGSNVEKNDTRIYWKFNGEKITSSNIKKPQANEDWTTFKLSITNVSENDVGEYQCVAAVDNYPHSENEAEASIYFQLSVLNVSTSKPNITVDEGATATLQCDLNYPEANDVWTFWLFNGDLIETRPFHTGNAQALSYHVSSMELELKHVTRTQSGIYTCGSNSTDLLSLQNISVRVVDAGGPKLTVSEAFKVFKRGTNATISCEAIYQAALFVDAFWVFNSSRISHEVNSKYGESNSLYETSKGNIKRRRLDLTIYEVGFHDIGQYTCVLNTSHGLRLQYVYVSLETSTDSPKEKTPSFSVRDKIDKSNDHPLSIILFIGLGLLAVLLTTAVVYFHALLEARTSIP